MKWLGAAEWLVKGCGMGGGGQAALAMVSVSSLCYQSLLRMKGFWVGLGEGSLEHMLDVVSPSAATLFPRERGRERERERRNLKSTKSGLVVSGSITPRKS